MSTKTCSSCNNWVKLGGFNGKGICEAFDYGWFPSDHSAKECKGFRPLKYQRDKNSKITLKDITYD